MSHSRSRRLVFLSLAFFTPVFAACDSAVAPELAGVRERTYEAAGERLAFGSMEELQEYLTPLQDAPKEELVAAESRNGFQSLRAYLDPNEDTEEAARAAGEGEESTGNETRALEQDGVTRADFPVSDAFLSVLNSRGEVEIEGKVFKVTRDYVYEVSPEYLPVLNERVPTLSSEAPADEDEQIIVRRVETTLTRESADDGSASVATAQGGARFNHVPGVGGHCYVWAGSNYRMHGRSYITNYNGVYSEAGVTTEWQRRRTFLWWSYWNNQWQSGTLSHSYEAALYRRTWWLGPWYAVGPSSGFQSQTGTARVHNTLAWGVGWGVRIRGNIHARHNVSNGYVTGSCNTAASA